MDLEGEDIFPALIALAWALAFITAPLVERQAALQEQGPCACGEAGR